MYNKKITLMLSVLTEHTHTNRERKKIPTPAPRINYMIFSLTVFLYYRFLLSLNNLGVLLYCTCLVGNSENPSPMMSNIK